MDKTNKYGFISGGYIFDLLDRTALQAINEKYPETASQQVYTTCGHTTYLKQLCDIERTKVVTTKCYEYFGEYRVHVELWQGETLIAHGYFTFVQAEHNYCEQ